MIKLSLSLKIKEILSQSDNTKYKLCLLGIHTSDISQIYKNFQFYLQIFTLVNQRWKGLPISHTSKMQNLLWGTM